MVMGTPTEAHKAQTCDRNPWCCGPLGVKLHTSTTAHAKIMLRTTHISRTTTSFVSLAKFETSW